MNNIRNRRKFIISIIIEEESLYDIDIEKNFMKYVRRESTTILNMINELKKESLIKSRYLKKLLDQVQKHMILIRDIQIEKAELLKERDELKVKLNDVQVIVNFLQKQKTSSIHVFEQATFALVHDSESAASETSMLIIESTIKVNKKKKSFKLLDSFVLENNDDDCFENWLALTRNKLKNNVDWWLIEKFRITYLRTRIDEDAIKHIAFRFRSDSIKSYVFTDEILDDLTRVYDDHDRKINAFKKFRELKQMSKYRDFSFFWAEFQRLINELKEFIESLLLKELINKMSYELQKLLFVEAYKIIDLYVFARICMSIDRRIRNVNTSAVGGDGFHISFLVSSDKSEYPQASLLIG